jgi:poly-gamma-glutamate capsule biosynthesis protein CapA/YwtB (metallophosphatase superfamily)
MIKIKEKCFMRPTMRITAAGDYLEYRRMPEDYEGFRELSDFIKRGDARFFNLETTFPDKDSWGSQFYGGVYLRSEESMLEDVKRYGFNILSFANNHTLDYSYGGMIRTLEKVREAGLPQAGVGMNLDEAAAPAYVDTKHGSVGLIGVVSTMMNVSAMAGRQSRRVLGRPGVNGLRIDEWVNVTPEQYEVLQEIVEQSAMNGQADISRSEGFTLQLPEGTLALKLTNFRRSSHTSYETHPNKTDMKRIVDSIGVARSQCDYVIVSLHSHEVGGRSKENPGDFHREFAKKCIDAGACAVIGHGPHLLRPVEMYKGCPIFYCLGNFVFREEIATCAPEDQYEKYGVTSDTPMDELYNIRTKGHTRGLMHDNRMLEAIVPCIEVSDDRVTKIELMPISLGIGLEYYQMGIPVPDYTRGIIERLAAMSEPYGTKIITRKDGIGEIVLE